MVGQIEEESTLDSSQRELDDLSGGEKKQMKLKSNLILSLFLWRLNSLTEFNSSKILTNLYNLYHMTYQYDRPPSLSMMD